MFSYTGTDNHGPAAERQRRPSPSAAERGANPEITAASDKDKHRGETCLLRGAKNKATMGPNLALLSEFPVGAIWRTMVDLVPLGQTETGHRF